MRGEGAEQGNYPGYLGEIDGAGRTGSDRTGKWWDAMSGIREQKKRATKAALARAATEIAVERGISGVSAVEVTETVGVSTRTFHNYFSTREEAVAHHIRTVMTIWPREILAAPEELDEITVLVRTAFNNIANGDGEELTYADALILSGSLSSLGNMAPHDLLLEGITAAATALSQRAGYGTMQDEHLVMVHVVWVAVSGAVLGARGADDPETAFRPLIEATLATAEKILRDGLFELPDGV